MVSTKVGDRLGSPCDDSPLFYIKKNHALFGLDCLLSFVSLSIYLPFVLFRIIHIFLRSIRVQYHHLGGLLALIAALMTAFLASAFNSEILEVAVRVGIT